MTDEPISQNDDTPLPPPGEVEGPPPSMDDIIEQAVTKAEEAAVESSVAPGAEGESPTPETQPSETPAPESEVTAEGSETSESTEDPGAGDSPSLEINGQTYSQEDVAGLIEANQNRDAFKVAAQEQAQKIQEQVTALEQAKSKMAAEKAALEKQREENQALAQYIQWKEQGGSGDLEDFVREVRPTAPRAPQTQPAESQEDLDKRIAALVDERLGRREVQGRQSTIENNFDGWVQSVVEAEPSFKGREFAYGAAITQRFVEECQKNKVMPTQFSDSQIQGFLKQYAREAAQVEAKLSETSMAERLDEAAKTKEVLPAAPKTQGTPLPSQPAGFSLDTEKMAREASDSEDYWGQVGEAWKQQADELSSMARNLK